MTGDPRGGVPVRLLLVEDSENDAMLLLRELRRGGYEPAHERVYTPEGMERALEEAEARGEPYEVVISDYYMPRFRAPDALELLRGLGYDVPFIVVSGKIGEDAAVGIMKAGANDYLTKENMARLCPAIGRELKEAAVRGEHARAEEALARSEIRFRRLVEQAADAMFVHDLEGRLVDVNRRACESLGYAREELLGLSVADVEVGHDPGSLKDMWEEVSSGASLTLEGEHRRKDGTVFPVEVRVGVFEDGGSPLVLALVRDVTGRKEDEEELRRSEERYRTFIDQSTEGIWRFELEVPMPTDLPEGEQLEHFYRHAYLAECNDAMARMYGFADASDLVGARIGDLLPRSDPGNIEFLRAAVVAGYRIKDGETRELDRMGNERVILNNLGGVIEDGLLVRVWGTQRDVTEGKEAEEQLARLASFPELDPNPIVETSLAGVPTYLNPAAQARFPDLRDLGPRHPVLADLEDANSRIWSAGGRPLVREVRVGGGFYQQVVSRTPEGGLLRIYATDVTERRRAEDALRASEERFRSLVQNASDIIVVLAGDGTIVYESPAVERVLGFGPEERIGLSALGLIHPEDRDRVAQVLMDHRDVPGPFPSLEYRVKDKQGSWRHLEAVGENLLHDPAVGGIVINSRDVTERRRTEEALRESEERYRELFTSIDEGFCLCEMILGDDGSPADYRFLEVNPKFEEMTGLADAAGKTARELVPGLEGRWAETYGRVGFGGETLRFEDDSEAMGRWFDVYASPVEPRGSGRFTLVFKDITERKRTEEALRVSEARASLALDVARLGTWSWDPARGEVLADARTREVCGLHPDASLSLDDIVPLIHPDDRPRIEAALGTAMQPDGDGRYAEEFRFVHTDGAVRWVISRGRTLFEGELRRPDLLLGTVLDITERRRAEDTLREAEERYRTLVEGLPAVTYVRHVGSDTLSYASPQLEAVLGYSPAEYLADPELFARTIHPDDRGGVIAEDERTNGTGEPYAVECRRITKDGRVVWVHDEAHLVRDAGGSPLYWQGFITDITDRKRAEESQRQSEELYRNVVEQAAESIFLLDVDSMRVLEANAALGATLGYSPEELKGMSFYDLSAHDKEAIDRNAERALREGRVSLGGRQYRRKDGGLVDVEISISVVPYDGGPTMCVVAHNVTERLRAERALGEIREAERNRIARELHDSILQDIVYALQELQVLQVTGRNGDPALGNVADALRRSVEGLRGAIFELRLEQTLESSLVGSLENLVDLNRRMARGAYEIELVVGEGVPERLPGGREILRIVQEALTNVRRHSGAGHVRVEIGVEGETLYAEVRDDGRGFDPRTSRKGVGRDSMRQRALDLGGGVEVQSEPGGGTRVLCRVPMGKNAP